MSGVDESGNGALQATFNLLRDGAILVLDTGGKNRIQYREHDDCYIRHGREIETPNDHTTCSDEHVARGIEEYGIRKVIRA